MKKVIVGGQAVIEGVLMKSPNHYNISIRRDKKILNKQEKIKQKPKFYKFFFIRGIVNLIEMLTIGIKALNWSAEKAEGGEALKKRDFFFYHTSFNSSWCWFVYCFTSLFDKTYTF